MSDKVVMIVLNSFGTIEAIDWTQEGVDEAIARIEFTYKAYPDLLRIAAVVHNGVKVYEWKKA